MKVYPLILLADDDEDDRMLFVEALSEINPGIECLLAKNGREALMLLQNDLFRLPDFIFLDINMPVINGLKCLMELKESTHFNHIPVVLYSTSSLPDYKEQAKKLGATLFFQKANSFYGLVKILKEILV